MITKPVRIEKEIIDKAHTLTDRYVLIKSKINNENGTNCKGTKKA